MWFVAFHYFFILSWTWLVPAPLTKWSGLNEYAFISQFFAFTPSVLRWQNLSGCWENGFIPLLSGQKHCYIDYTFAICLSLLEVNSQTLVSCFTPQNVLFGSVSLWEPDWGRMRSCVLKVHHCVRIFFMHSFFLSQKLILAWVAAYAMSYKLCQLRTYLWVVESRESVVTKDRSGFSLTYG